MYDAATGERLMVRGPDPQSESADYVDLGIILVP
jgi:hypothetical protein